MVFAKSYVLTTQYQEEIKTKTNNYTIVITGLGGQGLIRFLQILGDVLMRKGYKVITSEKHGLSQRGGKVTCFLRFGENYVSPIPIIGSADMIIATEKACILDVLKFAKPDRSSKLIIATYEKEPQSGAYALEEYLVKVLNENSNHIYFVSVTEIVAKFTNLKIINTIIAGYILRFLPITEENIKESIGHHFKKDLSVLNQKALEEGIKLK
ncbi:MAG: 2-oxoacid:acceptor oxidoreductase family protein [Candidatus Lokiarchaeota archaeon]|nr:2-oxoacid:acceptor oxidoreductase family protein [Candidatus Lokiarchaeota archaeon]